MNIVELSDTMQLLSDSVMTGVVLIILWLCVYDDGNRWGH